MVTFSPIDAPTAAIIGGVVGGAAGFAADNLTAVIQRRLRQQKEQLREEIAWYEETRQIAKEIQITAICHKSQQEIKMDSADSTMPTEEEIEEAVEDMTAEEFASGSVTIQGQEYKFTPEGFDQFPRDQLDFHKEGLTDELKKEMESMRWNIENEIGEEIRSDMKDFQSRLTQHYASAPDDIDEELDEEITSILLFCFGGVVSEWVTDDRLEDLKESQNRVDSLCESKIEGLS